MQFTDAVSVAGTRQTADGYLVADARIARTGVQAYRGFEMGRDDMDIVRVYRPGAEVFSDATLRSAAHRPVTNDHPADLVSAANWKDHAVGHTGDEVTGESIFIRVPMMVSDAAAIADIQSGKRELSAGYTCDIDWTSGKTPEGEAYDAIQKSIRLNHVAIVQRGRAGNEVRIGDGATTWGAAPITPHTADRKESPMADNLRTVVVDGLSVQTTDQGAQAIEKLQKDVADSKAALESTKTAHVDALKAKDTELAKKDAEIDDLKGKILDEAAIDAKVQARADLIGKAKAIMGDSFACDGKTDADIRADVVKAKCGDEAAKKGPAYVDARFDILVEAIGKDVDPFRAAMRDRSPTPATVNDNGQAAYEKRLADSWKTQKEA